MLLEPDVRASLERLALRSRGRLRGVWGGRHRSVRRGESLDFADYRPYLPGDDFRRIDYNTWARLGVVLVRLFEAEDEMPLRVLVDASSSMRFGAKFAVAQRLAGVLTYLGLAGGDGIRLGLVPGGRPGSIAGPIGRHLSSWARLEAWIEGLEPGGGTDLTGAARFALGQVATRGPAVLISDLLAPGWEQALDLLGAGPGGLVLHVLSPAELEPELTGDLTLVDAETGREVPVSLNPNTVAAYRRRVQAFLEEAKGRARRHGLEYLLVTAIPGAHRQLAGQLVAVGAAR